MVNKLPENPTWDDYKKDYEEWRTAVLKETLEQLKGLIAADRLGVDKLQTEIGRKSKHVELIESELQKR